MLIKKIQLQNFMPFTSEEVVFPNGTISILGEYEENASRSNGAGKSSLIEAVLYALFGKSRTVSEIDMVKQGADGDMYVQLVFDFNNQEYVVKRGRTKSGQAIVFLSINGNPIGGGVRDIDANIVKSLGMTLEVFTATCFFEQNRIDSFTTATPSKRKEYLSSILDLQIYESCSLACKQLRDQLNSEYEKTQGGIQHLIRLKTEKEALDNHQFTINKNEDKKVEIEKRITTSKFIVEETSAAITRFQQELQSSSELVVNLSKLKNQYNGKLGSVEKIKRDVESKKNDLKSKWESKNLLAKMLPEIEEKKNAITSEISSFEEQRSSSGKTIEWEKETSDTLNVLKQEQGEVSGRVKHLRSEISSLSTLGTQCITCKQTIDKNTVDNLIGTKESQVSSDLLVIDDIKTKITKLTQDLLDDQKIKEKLSTLKNQLVRIEGEIILSSSAKKERDEISITGKSQIESLEDILKTSIEELKELETQVQQLQERVSNLPTEENTGLDKLKIVLDMRKEEVNLLQNDIKKCDEFIIRAKTYLEEIQKLGTQIEQETSQIKDKQLQLQAYQDLVEVFSQRGIPAIIIENTVSEVENITNEYLAELGSVFKINIRSQKETKKGDLKETLDILIVTPEGVRDYSTYSGGEKTIINLCLRLSLSTVLSSRNKVHFDSIFLDEVISSLDTENRENFLKLIKILSNKFSQIFIISHIEEMKNVFDHSIKVVKSQTGSKVVVER